MNPHSEDDEYTEEKHEVGPLTEAYLQRDVHPDEKASHGQGSLPSSLLPDEAPEPWTYT